VLRGGNATSCYPVGRGPLDEELEALLNRVPLDATDRARADKLVRRLSRRDPEDAARYAANLVLPLWVEETPVVPRRAGVGGLRAPWLPTLSVPKDPFGPALQAWWDLGGDRRPLRSALSLALPNAPPELGAEISGVIRALSRGEDVWPAARRALSLWPGCAAPLALPLGGPVDVAPDPTTRARRMAIGGGRAVDLDELAVLWDALPDGTWVDLGSGSGDTVRGLSRPGRRVIGVDVAPPAEVVLPVSPWPEAMHAAALRGVGRPVDVVVMCYPSHAEQVTAGRRRARAVVFQLDTAIALLRPGGVLVLVTESPGVMRSALAGLGGPRVHAVDLVASPVGEQALRDFGVVPYTPRVNQLIGGGDDERPVRPFGWGFVAMVWTRPG
jgi:hypothetical protein